MLDRIKDLFAAPKTEAPPEDHDERVRVATCVILLEMARVDEEFSPEEREQIVRALRNRFSLSDEEAHELIEAATESRKESVDLWSFTHQINEACTTAEKLEITEEVWRVVYADGGMDGHEDYLAHKLAKLFNLTHPMLIEAKLKVLKEVRGK